MAQEITPILQLRYVNRIWNSRQSGLTVRVENQVLQWYSPNHLLWLDVNLSIIPQGEDVILEID
jgi:hypothetical protein